MNHYIIMNNMSNNLPDWVRHSIWEGHLWLSTLIYNWRSKGWRSWWTSKQPWTIALPSLQLGSTSTNLCHRVLTMDNTITCIDTIIQDKYTIRMIALMPDIFMKDQSSSPRLPRRETCLWLATEIELLKCGSTLLLDCSKNNLEVSSMSCLKRKFKKLEETKA